MVFYLFFFYFYLVLYVFFFFFQAEDGIRDYKVTGVQTCALPIYLAVHRDRPDTRLLRRRRQGRQDRPLDGTAASAGLVGRRNLLHAEQAARRSEERRVGKECRSRGWPWE